MAVLPEDATYMLKKVTIDLAAQDIDVQRVSVKDVPKKSSKGESLSETMKQLEADELMQENNTRELPGLLKHPELPEDYIRNFLVRKNMQRALAAFQAEWYEMDWKDASFRESTCDETVPDCYLEIADLERKVERLQTELGHRSSETTTAATTASKLSKERDYHRLCHRQIKQEKKEMQNEITRLHAHYQGLQDKATTVQKRYERSQVAKTNALNELKKSRKHVDDVVALSETVLQLSQDTLTSTSVIPSTTATSTTTATEIHTMLPPPTHPDEDVNNNNMDSALPEFPNSMWSELDMSTTTEQHRGLTTNTAASLTLTAMVHAHDGGVSAMAVDTTSKQLLTGSDDGTFKTWDLQPGELILSSKCSGHQTWVSACKFHPNHALAATASGDGTVKLWDLDKGDEKTTFFGHRYAVWDVDFHCSGDFVASASLDCLVKLWDLSSERCRKTLRAHTDSVNSVEFQSLSNLCVSASVDRTCVLWDVRTALKIATLRGHNNACNQATFSPTNERIASIDADGIVKIWEVRTGTELASLTQATNVPANKCCFDASGEVLAVACDDNIVRLYDSNTLDLISQLKGHSDAVQAVAFASAAGPLVSGGADGTVRFWS